MSSIDFRGVGGVVEAYKAASIETWAVFNKKNIMQAGTGEEMLSEYLTMMEQHSSTTTYTLRMYRNENADNITDRTEYNSSFSFQLSERNGGYVGGGFIGGGGNIGARLAAIEKKLSGEGPEKEPTIASTIMGWFQEPDDVVKILGAIKMFTGKASPEQLLQTVSALGAVEPKRAGSMQLSEVTEPGELSVEQEQVLLRYVTSIERLERCDPEFPLHLERLANLAETKPEMYKMALSFLK